METEFLRGSKFPDSVRIALKDIERSLPHDQGAAIPGLGHSEGNAERIADEYIFMHRAGRLHSMQVGLSYCKVLQGSQQFEIQIKIHL
jgi:hypothetical protein